MGWLFGEHSKESLIERCLRGDAHPTDYTAIAHSVVGNHLWTVFERDQGKPDHTEYNGRTFPRPARLLTLHLLAYSKRDDCWGYKDMDESMGPYEYDCPLKYLDMVPDPGGYATGWRDKVRAFHAGKRDKRALVKSIRPGMRLKLIDGCRPAEITVISTSPLVGYADGGGRYKIQPRHIDRVLDVA
jgi:hypothetical protein